jgi:hypothetical protein
MANSKLIVDYYVGTVGSDLASTHLLSIHIGLVNRMYRMDLID